MEYALIAIIVIAVIAIIYLLVKLHEQKAYYRYIADKLSHTEEKSSRTIDDLKESVRGLKRELNTDITTKIGNRDYFIKKTLQLLERNPEHKYTIIGKQFYCLTCMRFRPRQARLKFLWRQLRFRLKRACAQGNGQFPRGNS